MKSKAKKGVIIEVTGPDEKGWYTIFAVDGRGEFQASVYKDAVTEMLAYNPACLSAGATFTREEVSYPGRPGNTAGQFWGDPAQKI